MIAQPQRLSISLSIIFVVACVLTITTQSNPTGLTLNLIHRDLIYPPTNAHGVASLSKVKNTNQTSYHKKQVGELKRWGKIFLLEYFIGTPGIRQYAILDTGSSIPLVQCMRPTPEHKRFSNFYNESASSSYIPSSCPNRYCELVSHNQCDTQQRCEYNVTFHDTSYSKGHIGFETISFSDGGHRNQSAIIKNVLFGCQTDKSDPHGYDDGVFGIGGLFPVSIIRELQMHRFSFCFGSINDPSNRYNHLALGSDARLEGNSVPYRRGHGFSITVNSIIIGSNRRSWRNFFVYIDSGSSISFFVTNVYNAIKSEVNKTIGTHMRRKNSDTFREGLCYETTNIWNAFPNVTIESGGLPLFVLNIEGMFMRTFDNALCLAIKPTYGLNVIGVVQMQHYNVGFDLDSMKAYFRKRTDCNRN